MRSQGRRWRAAAPARGSALGGLSLRVSHRFLAPAAAPAGGWFASSRARHGPYLAFVPAGPAGQRPRYGLVGPGPPASEGPLVQVLWDPLAAFGGHPTRSSGPVSSWDREPIRCTESSKLKLKLHTQPAIGTEFSFFLILIFVAVTKDQSSEKIDVLHRCAWSSSD